MSGYKKYVTDENGFEGYYEITAEEILYGADTTQYGQVWVDTYYDHESDQTYTPLAAGNAVGFNYLGSEVNYIVSSWLSELHFGNTAHGAYHDEADYVLPRFTFGHYYGNGDDTSYLTARIADNFAYPEHRGHGGGQPARGRVIDGPRQFDGADRQHQQHGRGLGRPRRRDR